MSDHIQARTFDIAVPDLTWECPALPPWLARRLLRPGEEVTWVRGPRWNPRAERYLTHPALFLLALLVAAGCLAVGRLAAGSWSAVPLPLGVAAVGVVIGSIYTLAITNAYFTRLVVTNFRLLIVQGYEVCRQWGLDQLPRSLVRYGRRGDESSRTVDLEALQTLFGGASDRFADSKTIRAVGKQLQQIKAREEGRP